MLDNLARITRRRLGRSVAGFTALPLLGVLLLGTAGCMSTAVDAPPVSAVFFTPFSADLDAPARLVIDHVSRDAAAVPTRSVVVEGYADSAGTPATNRTLSQLRAQVVADALVAQGVERRRISMRPRGQSSGDPGIESRRVDVSFGR